jgi:nucleoside-diphosphate-sugar epimerase
LPDFDLQYKPDYRQTIADSWPQSIDDSVARNDWGWQPNYDIDKMTVDMLNNHPENKGRKFNESN